MRRQIIVILVSLFWFALPSAWGADRGALFKVTSEGRTMYLFGTIHVGVPGFYPLEPRIAQIVAQAPALALEIDTGRDPAMLARAMQQHGLLAPGEALTAKMPPAQKLRLEKALARAGIPASLVAGLKPWVVATTLALAEYRAQGYRPELGVEGHLAQLARTNGVPVTELESVDEQLALFGRLGESEQMRVLDEVLETIEDGRQGDEAREIAEAWGSADRVALDLIAKRVEEDQTLSGRFLYKVLLVERNAAMAGKLARLITQKNNSVAAVGVLHLIGKTSIPELLRARGMTVERVY
ncbi:TraB/GumN family protein [Massilia cavernae]|uniref:TraB/GumN family protein n=1 Tax=Massilia cavernae TaxID=2320864 RepID=A0A418XTB1_9BURK|nr:TraB/GumN family protein [Massilia cavernae]RJG15894.1 TraB/GumN family protein [Massilia cavernae]